MSVSKFPGRSHRTPFKHWILDAELGRLCGIFGSAAKNSVPALACPFHVIDMCAGDGHSSDESNVSSPGVINYHLRKAHEKGVRVRADLYEVAPYTFAELQKNVFRNDWTDHWFHVHNSNSCELTVCPTDSRQAIFVNADPNSIAQWPISKEMASSLTETTTLLATLGCNVGGLKRMKKEDRLQWFEHVRDLVDGMPSYHDAILVRLEGDDAQWAYLLRLPKKWSKKTKARILGSGRQYVSHELDAASLRFEKSHFMEMQDVLFLTKAELKAAQ